MSDALDDLLGQLQARPELYRQFAEFWSALTLPTLQLIWRDIAHSLSKGGQAHSSQAGALYEVMCKAQDDPELARVLAVCIARPFATPALLRTCLDTVLWFHNRGQAPMSWTDLEQFAKDVHGGRELIVVIEECGLEIVGLANQLTARRESHLAVMIPGPKLQVEPISLPDFPRIWWLFGFLLPRRVRQEVFEPAQEEMKEEYLRALRPLCTRGEARWLTMCFSFHTLVVVFQSAGAAIGDRGRRCLKLAVSATLGAGAFRILRSFWQELWRK